MIWLSMISSLFTASFALLTTGDSHPDAIRSKGTQIQARFSEPMDEKAAMGLADLGSRHDPGGSPPIQLIDEAFAARSEEHTSELQSLMRTSYAVFCLKKKI